MYKTMYFVWGAYIENLWNGFAPQEHPQVDLGKGLSRKPHAQLAKGTNTHQCIIQWMPIITRLWMNLI
jgi:hypothetical protein